MGSLRRKLTNYMRGDNDKHFESVSILHSTQFTASPFLFKIGLSSLYWRTNANKNFPLLWVKTNPSKWSKFPKVCKNRWRKNLSALLWSSYQIHNKRLGIHWFSASKGKKKSHKPNLLVGSWWLISLKHKGVIYQHVVTSKTIANGEYYVCFENFATTDI